MHKSVYLSGDLAFPEGAEADSFGEDNEDFINDDESDDEFFQTFGIENDPCFNEEVRCAYVGQVKHLTEKFETFKKCQYKQKDIAKMKISNFVSTREGPSTSADSVDDLGILKQANSAKENENESLEFNRRLDVLEEKMDAVATYVTHLFMNKVETLGHNFHRKNLTIPRMEDSQTQAKDFNDELKEVKAQLSHLALSKGRLKEDHRKMEKYLDPLKLTFLNGLANNKRRLQIVLKNLWLFEQTFQDFSNRNNVKLQARILNQTPS